MLADEIEDLDTTTPDSADTGIAETSADSLNSASEVSNDDIDNAQAESNAKDSDTEDTTAKDQRSKKTNSRKHKKPQKPNKIKASLARLNQFIKANAAPILTSKFAQLLISAAVALHKLWKKRPKCPYTLYVVVMALIDAAAVTFIQWGMYSEPKYDDPNAVDSTTKILNSVNGQLTRFVTQMWLEEDKLNWLLNFLVLGMVYLVLVFVINRFWVATAVFAITMSVYAVANSIKIILRNEPILPSDLSFLSSGNGGEITSFIPKSSQALVDGTITMLIWLTVICLILQFVDGRRCVIPFHWWRPFRNVKTIIGNVTRIIAAAMSITLLCSFTGRSVFQELGDMNGQSLGVIHRNSGVPKVMQQTTVLSSISCASRTRKSWISPRGTARKRWKSWPRNTAPRQTRLMERVLITSPITPSS